MWLHGRVACPFGLRLWITYTHGCPALVAVFWRQEPALSLSKGGHNLHSEWRVPHRLPMNKSMLAPEEQRVHSRTPWLGDAGGFPCARGGAALLAQRCSRRTALPCAADETECEPVCEPWR